MKTTAITLLTLCLSAICATHLPAQPIDDFLDETAPATTTPAQDGNPGLVESPPPGTGQPQFGIAVQAVEHGVFVAKVLRGTDADRLGLKPGDVIQYVNGYRVRTAEDIKYGLLLARIQDNRVKLGYLRNRRLHVATSPQPTSLVAPDSGIWNSGRMFDH